MKISELKQPYRRMAEYLADKNYIEEASNRIYNLYKQGSIMDIFCRTINSGNYPPITEEIKKHFPPDFDFSEKEIENISINEKYTQLAKEGKFDELPDTCEFSEAVKLEVCDGGTINQIAKVIGKFKGKFVEKEDISRNGYTFWNFAQLPTPKIDFSQFKSGDVVEVELSNEEKRIGWFDFTNETHLYIRILQRKGNQICNGGSCAGTKIINKEKIKSITKIK